MDARQLRYSYLPIHYFINLALPEYALMHTSVQKFLERRIAYTLTCINKAPCFSSADRNFPLANYYIESHFENAMIDCSTRFFNFHRQTAS